MITTMCCQNSQDGKKERLNRFPEGQTQGGEEEKNVYQKGTYRSTSSL